MSDSAAGFAVLKLGCLRLAAEYLRWMWERRQVGAPPTLADVRAEGERLYRMINTVGSGMEIPDA